MMLTVVAVQPLLIIIRRWLSNRRLAVIIALLIMSFGALCAGLAGNRPGLILFGIGFGMFVVMSTVWVKESAPVAHTGRFLGVYGLGTALGGAFGAPAGLFVAEHSGLSGVVALAALSALAALIPVRLTHPRANSANVDERPTKSTSSAGDAASHPSRRPRTFLILNLAVHFAAVGIYALVLSSTGSITGESSPIWQGAMSAFIIQLSCAVGRLVGGGLADHLLPPIVLTGSLSVLTVGAGVALFTPPSLAGFLAVAAVGLGSGVSQTAVLTAMMRCASGSEKVTERFSVIWNIVFDSGLGAGAAATAVLVAK